MVTRFGALVVVLAVLVRAHHALLPLDDPSVGLYAHVARSWLAGHAPYTQAWEYKPPGLFAIYALVLAFVGAPGLALQLLGVGAALATAYALYKIGPLVDPAGGAATGRYAALFAVMLGIEDEGYLTDAEVIGTPLVALALWLALSRPVRSREGLGIGLLLGVAVQCKLSLLPLVAPVLAIVALEGNAALAPLVLVAVGVVSFAALEILGYAAIGQLPALVSANVGATAARTAGLRSGVLAENVSIFREHLRIYAPALELAVLAIGHRFTARTLLATAGWLAAGLVSILGIGEYFDRQFVVLYAPVALLGAIGLRRAVRWLAPHGIAPGAALAIVFITTFGLHDYYETLQGGRLVLARAGVAAVRAPDRFTAVVRTLACVRKADESVFLIAVSPFVYDLAGAESPTKFAYTDHLLDERMRAMIGVDPLAELRRIFAGRPHVIAVDDNYRNARHARERIRFIDERIARDYVAVATAPHTTYYVAAGTPDAPAIARRCAGL